MREKKNRKNNDEKVIEAVVEVTNQYPYYGYRRVTAILQHRYKYNVNRKRVERIMKERGLLLPPSFSNKKLFRGIPFSLKVEATKSNALWGIDMTYIWCGEDGWCYLHGVIDHFDKVLIGYNFSRSCKAIGAVMAISEGATERPVGSLELRSDNGCHYGSRDFQGELKRLGIYHTRTMVNTPKGNAIIERFFRSLKEECVWQNQFKNFEEAKEKVDAWIKHYNETRPHQALKYECPAAFYAKTNAVRNAA